MKKITFLTIVLCICVFSYSQENTSSQENITLDQMLVNINKSSVTSGIIYERVGTFANLYHYNKELDTADVNYFEEALSEMYYGSNKTKFISNSALRQLYTPTTNVIDIGIINTQYQLLNYDSSNESLGGLTLSNNLFSQIPGKPPFLGSSVVVIAPLKQSAYGSSSLLFNNGTKTIKNLSADLGDGISRNVIVNGSLILSSASVDYPIVQNGYKYLKFTVTFNDNSTHVTYGKIYARYSPPHESGLKPGPQDGPIIDKLIDYDSINATVAFKGYDETAGTLAHLEYRVFYRNSAVQKTIMKPIIISDGFDPGDKRKIQRSDYYPVPYDPIKDRAI